MKMKRTAVVLALVVGAGAVGMVRLSEPTPASAGEPVIVTADDGTVTVNQPQDDGTVKGSVTLPDGSAFTFPETPDAAPETPAETVVSVPEGEAPTSYSDAEVEGQDAPPCDEGFHEDGGYCAPIQEVDPAIQEDDPAFDCRWDGNQTCGVTIKGMTYLIQFEDGSPVNVHVAPGN